MHRRLRRNDKISDDHGNRNQNPVIIKRSNFLSDIISHRHKTNIDACQEKNQTDICIYNTNQNLKERPLAHFQNKKVEYQEKHEDRSKRNANLFHVIGKRL